MPLNEGARNDILLFGGEAREEVGEILSQEKYKADVQRRIGHQPGIARQELVTKTERQSSFMATAFAQFLANRHAYGIRDDGDIDKVEEIITAVISNMITGKVGAAVPLSVNLDEDGRLIVSVKPGLEGQVLMVKDGKLQWTDPTSKDTGQYYWFEDEIERPGLFPCMGGLITNVSQKYPEIVSYLKSDGGRFRCVTQAEYDVLHVATWHTCADGTKIGWEGIGGVNKFVLDLVADTLRLPDLRGMSPEMIGDSLGVGGVHGDMMRRVTASWINGWAGSYIPTVFAGGAVYTEMSTANQADPGGGSVTTQPNQVRFDNDRVAPTGAKNAPRAWGALACVYLGQPAS